LFIRASVDAFGAAGVVILRTHWRHYLFLGFFQTALPFFLFALALKEIGVSLGSIINATSPLFGLVSAIAIGDEALRWQRILELALGITGVIALVGIDSPTHATDHLPAILLGLGAVIQHCQQLYPPICTQRTRTRHGHL